MEDLDNFNDQVNALLKIGFEKGFVFNTYSLGKIYGFWYDDVLCYIGSSVDIESRKRQHNSPDGGGPWPRLVRLMDGTEQFSFQIIEHYPCKNKTELVDREMHHVRVKEPLFNGTRKFPLSDGFVNKLDSFLLKLHLKISRSYFANHRSDNRFLRLHDVQLIHQKIDTLSKTLNEIRRSIFTNDQWCKLQTKFIHFSEIEFDPLHQVSLRFMKMRQTENEDTPEFEKLESGSIQEQIELAKHQARAAEARQHEIEAIERTKEAAEKTKEAAERTKQLEIELELAKLKAGV